MTEKKITDKKLKQEIKEGKTEKEIAYDNGYGYPNGRLNQRIRNLGFEKNQKLTIQSSGGAQFYFSSDTIKGMAEEKGIDLQSVDKLFFRVRKIGDGRRELVITENSFRQVEQNE